VIAESQLEIWASQGPTAQFMNTYNRIRDNLLDRGVPYPLADTEVYLQGSYNNDTNVYGDSDVDMVLCHTGAFYDDRSRLSPEDRHAYEVCSGGAVTYGFGDFKRDATAYITRLYNNVNAGEKALHIPGATLGAGTRTCSSRPSFGATTSSSPGRTSATAKGCASSPRAAR
jgi:hypothetical protein